MNSRIGHVHNAIGPVLTAPLFRPLHAQLAELLRGLPAEAWHAQTSAPAWQVRDVVAHLLDTELRRIAVDRDNHGPPAPRQPVNSHDSLVDYLNALNAEWVTAARRISPQLLTELLELTGPVLASLMEQADPNADATYPVTWAGQDQSPMWLDIAREYTERWHHQDQIREAVAAPPLDGAVWLLPALDVSMLALPPGYAATHAPAGTTVLIHSTGPVVATWLLTRTEKAWRIERQPVRDSGQDGPATACVATAPALVLARLLMHRLNEDAAAAQLHIEGDARLAAPLLRTRAVMV